MRRSVTMPVGVADGDPGGVGQRVFGPHAEAEHDEVGRQRAPIRRHAANAVAVGVEALDTLVRVERHADAAERVGHERAHVRVERAHRLRPAFHEGDLEAAWTIASAISRPM